MDEAPGAARGVTCRYEASPRSNDREARALRRWKLTQGRFWARWALTWVVFVTAVLVGVHFLVEWLAPEASGFLSWAVYLGGAMMLAAALVDAGTLPGRMLRRYQKVVDRQTPVGTPVEQSFSADTFTVTTPRAAFEVPTASITEASWLRECLVLEGNADGVCVMNGDGIDDRAMQAAIEVLGDRLRQR